MCILLANPKVRLTGDVAWPASTPFDVAIGAIVNICLKLHRVTTRYLTFLLGPLAGAFPILSLRTSKADVVVGVDQARADQLDKEDYTWRFTGKFVLEFASPS